MRSSEKLTKKSEENSPTKWEKCTDEEKGRLLSYLKEELEREEARNSQVVRK